MFRPKGQRRTLLHKRTHQKHSEERDSRGISADENTDDSSYTKHVVQHYDISAQVMNSSPNMQIAQSAPL